MILLTLHVRYLIFASKCRNFKVMPKMLQFFFEIWDRAAFRSIAEKQQIVEMANQSKLSHFFLDFEVITYGKVKQFNWRLCIHGVEFVVSD